MHILVGAPELQRSFCQPHIRHFPISPQCPGQTWGKLLLLISELFHQEAAAGHQATNRKGRKFTGKSVNAKYGNVYIVFPKYRSIIYKFLNILH